MSEIDDLIQINQEQARINREQSEQLAIQQQQIEYLKRQLYGRKSEKHIEHLELFESEEDVPGKRQARPKK